jgi:hypothetical protein
VATGKRRKAVAKEATIEKDQPSKTSGWGLALGVLGAAGAGLWATLAVGAGPAAVGGLAAYFAWRGLTDVRKRPHQLKPAS